MTTLDEQQCGEKKKQIIPKTLVFLNGKYQSPFLLSCFKKYLRKYAFTT
jgi:hypothetical protein